MMGKRLKKIPRIYFVIGCVVSFILFFIVLFSSHVLKPVSVVKKAVVDTDNSVYYQVHLKDNPYLSNPSSDRFYISDMVDSIDVHFRKTGQVHTESKVSYHYSIYAVLSSYYAKENGEDEEIWSKKYSFVSEEKSAKKNFTIDEKVSIPYDTYSSLLEKFQNKYHLGLSSTLHIYMDISYRYQGKKEKDTIELSLPMNEDVFQITKNYKDNYSIVDQEKVTLMKSSFLVVCFELGLLGFIFVVCLILFVFSFSSPMSLYDREKKRIWKSYSSIMVMIQKMIPFSKYTVIDVSSIEDMVRLEEELRSPILVYESKSRRVTYYVILQGDYCYRYSFKEK